MRVYDPRLKFVFFILLWFHYDNYFLVKSASVYNWVILALLPVSIKGVDRSLLVGDGISDTRGLAPNLRVIIKRHGGRHKAGSIAILRCCRHPQPWKCCICCNYTPNLFPTEKKLNWKYLCTKCHGFLRTRVFYISTVYITRLSDNQSNELNRIIRATWLSIK